MTFDLNPELESRLLAVREWAQASLAPAAPAIDQTGVVPLELRARLDALGLWSQGALDAVVMLEELSACSPAAAARLALGAGDGVGLAGLRGVAIVAEPSDQQALGLAAVCVGIGRAALEVALHAARARGDRPAGEPADPPHWALADAATEVDAARLLARSAAGGLGMDASAVLAFAGGAALRAVDAAVRIVGVEAWQPGSVLERCARDIRAALLVAGSEDEARRRAADRLLG